jgi:hypothetical protein
MALLIGLFPVIDDYSIFWKEEVILELMLKCKKPPL